jgi:hypothetical protein
VSLCSFFTGISDACRCPPPVLPNGEAVADYPDDDPLNPFHIARAGHLELQIDESADRELALVGSEEDLDRSSAAVARRLEVKELGVFELSPLGRDLGRYEVSQLLQKLTQPRLALCHTNPPSISTIQEVQPLRDCDTPDEHPEPTSDATIS